MTYLVMFPLLKVFELIGAIILLPFPQTRIKSQLTEEHNMAPSPGRKYANYDKYDPTGSLMLNSENDIYQSQHDEHEKAKQRIMASVEGVIRLIAVQNGLNPNGENLGSEPL